MRKNNVKKLVAMMLSLMMIFTIMPHGLVFASANNDATLIDIAYGSWGVPNFNAATTEYEVKVPYIYKVNDFSVDVPMVRAKTNDPDATVDISYPDSLPGDAVITVTAADGTTTKAYTLTMTAIGTNKISDGGMENLTDVAVESNGENHAEQAHKIDQWYGTSAMTIKESDISFGGEHSLSVTKSNYAYHAPSAFIAVPDRTHHISSFMARTAEAGKTHTTSQKIWDASGAFNGSGITSGVKFYENDTEKQGMNLSNTWNRYSAAFVTEELCGIAKLAHSYHNWSSEPEVLIDDYYLGELIYDVKITDDDDKNRIVLSSPKENMTINLSADVVNQFGGEQGINAEDIASDMTLIGAPTGVTISDGVLTIPVGTETCSFEVSAEVVPTITYPAQSKVIGRYRVDIIDSFDSASLIDIEFDGRGVEGFTPDKMDYTMYVPYKYEANNFDNFPEINITAVPKDENAKVEITYPTEDGAPIIIDVTAADGIAYKQYTVTPKKIGQNLYVDGGFENGSLTVGTTNGNITTSSRVQNSEDVDNGNFSMKVNRTAFCAFWFTPQPKLSAGKMYILSHRIKLGSDDTRESYSKSVYFEGVTPTERAHYDSNGTRTEKNTDAITKDWLTVFNTVILPNDYNIKAYYTSWVDAEDKGSLVYDDVYAGETIVADVDVTDETSSNKKEIKVPETGSTQISLAAVAKNQFGNTAGVALDTHMDVTDWKVIGEPEGITVSDGTVTVTSQAKPGIYKIQAEVAPKEAYTGKFTQSSANGRFVLTVLPAKEGGSFSYSKAQIEPGDIVCNLSYGYAGKTETEFSFITALYKVENNVETLVKAEVSDTIKLTAPSLITETQTVKVTDDAGTYIIRNFIWDMKDLTPLASPFGELR